MNKKLPSLFQNKIDKKLNNNEVYYVSNKESIPKFSKNEIEKKINDIFSSSSYIYRVNTIITLKSGVIEKKIIGKNKNALITIDNELIPIDDIIDISLKKEVN
ncbi:MAG: hypothetical protein J6G98_05480 [Bacilli bacterium]|nr:hypothetical protein [Bacilli bacterium]